MDSALVGLADVIEALRTELTRAVAKGADQVMRFSVEPVELTLQAVITKEADGRIGWKILEFGATYEAAQTQTVTVKLTPLWKTTDGSFSPNFLIAAPGLASDVVGPHD